MTVSEALALGKKFFLSRGFDARDAEHETRLILAFLLGLRPLDLYLRLDSEVPEGLFRRLLAERASGKPLAYVLGEVEFWGRTFKIRPGVLIPRPETEILVEAFLKAKVPEGPVLELGVGSGVILVTCLLERAGLKGLGIDIQEGALRLALENAKLHGVAERMFLVRGDWLSPLRFGPKFSALVSNPPYVSARDLSGLSREILDHEPLEALYGGWDGLAFVRRTLEKGPGYLKPGGKIFLEIGYDQREAVEEICRRCDLKVYFEKDLSGIARVAVVEK
ncbi:peptide chain release factor N(5)-glutamine methyltransferase [Thermosulfurimonas dismutans]|uniref:Release factor glutamine methyltransferase n=1 Tax=Thermosulfurimonas dismutans TaxID=999894 RepID=A0A179D2S9_9BACT|nr:peptide chain release factor N(5)-glutamine methyltransferase [Thermosulfurimonas dismutans]OAQ20367.1 Protein-N(5)-glutamine methyltransferase PrmC [Thermosulfurimonas dismutans]